MNHLQSGKSPLHMCTEILAEPDAVLAAFTEALQLKAWWGVSHAIIDKRIGGVYILAWDWLIKDHREKAIGVIATGRISDLQPEKQLKVHMHVYSNPEKPLFGPLALVVDVCKAQRYSIVNLQLTGADEGPDWEWYMEGVRQVGPNILAALKTYLEKSEISYRNAIPHASTLSIPTSG